MKKKKKKPKSGSVSAINKWRRKYGIKEEISRKRESGERKWRKWRNEIMA